MPKKRTFHACEVVLVRISGYYKVFGTDRDCVAVLFNLIKNTKALFKILKFLSVSD